MAACHDFAGIVVCRLLLGACEAGNNTSSNLFAVDIPLTDPKTSCGPFPGPRLFPRGHLLYVCIPSF